MKPWQTAFESRDDLRRYEENALGLFALALKFGLDDLDTVAADSITDGSDDKKCDIVYIDVDEGVAIIVQCYHSRRHKSSAPANKATDLNAAVSWLLQVPLEQLPERLRSTAQRLRSAISDGSITNLHIWYVHNLPEGKNVARELLAVEATAHAAINSEFPEKEVEICSLEIGQSIFEAWYADTQSQILVNDNFSIEIENGYELSGPDWRAFVTTIPASFLHGVYKKHETKLFSANVREYLGSRTNDSNINFGIKKTAETEPYYFWVFNNGLTVLVNGYDIKELPGGKRLLDIKGMSIVNGAQTTGAIGSLNKMPREDARVQVRFVKTNNSDLVLNIVQFNNSQNKITASDFRSTDTVQKRLKEQFSKIPKAEYTGGRRGSYGDAIQRKPNLLPSYTVGQALAALHSDPVTAYNQKTNIWANDRLYSKYFNEDTTAAHIVFAYSLLRSIEARKIRLVAKAKENEATLTKAEQQQLQFFRKRGSIYILVSAISACIETFTGRRIPNLFRVSFGEHTSPADSQGIWDAVVGVTVPFCSQLEDAMTDGLKNMDKVNKAIQTFQSLVLSTESANEATYKQFARYIKIR